MRTNESIRTEVVPLMQRTRTWVLLYALGIAVLVLSLCRTEEGRPPEKTVVQVAVPSGPSP